MDEIKFIADIEDEELDEEDLMDIWDSKNVVHTLDQPAITIIIIIIIITIIIIVITIIIIIIIDILWS